MTTVPRSVRVFAPLLAILALPGCGIVELIASGASDGTKYMIRTIDERNAATGTERGAPATMPAASPIADPAATPPEAEPPAVTSAPVIPVTRGELLD